jgi:hypothetical protein
MKYPLILILILLAASRSSAQRPASPSKSRDSTVAEVRRMTYLVDSLRKVADRQDTVWESAKHMVELLKTGKDTAMLAQWQSIAAYVESSFDSTLTRLNSAVGRLNALTHYLDSTPRKKH